MRGGTEGGRERGRDRGKENISNLSGGEKILSSLALVSEVGRE